MKKKSNRLFKTDSIWHGIITMGMGTVIAQMINVLVQPILTRIVEPSVLGVYTYIVSLATMIIPISSLKLDMLIVTSDDDERAQYITDSCIIINSIIFILYYLVLVVGKEFLHISIFEDYGAVIYIVPVLVITNGIRFLFISYNNRYKKYKVISIVAILREGLRAIIQIVLGLITGGVVGQTLGYACSPFLGLHIQMKDYVKKCKGRDRIGFEKFKEILCYGKRQIFYLVPAQFINSFSASLITIFITALYSSTSLGYYSAGVRILDIPIIFITSNVSKVIYQRVSESVEKKEYVFKTVASVACVIAIISIVGFSVLYIIAPNLTRVVFGSGYDEAGLYIRCLCTMYAMRLVATSFTGIYTVFGKQQYEFVLNVILICVAVVAYAIGKIFDYDIIHYLWIIGIGYTITYMIMLGGYLYLCRKHDKMISHL